ncbi:hypothetical protein HMPREF9715_01517 [Myroides odoratimimus CIP 101113]|uniref:Uncharacterized protein n=1 Tax=Myroides odoratimimus CIP 101113 TaxID=883154 RepID=A0AAV3F2X7_9FLAO|nr:hypothetical protein HMPREF9715_01517 [Myroides odoratimimus CIP 101113]
MFYFFIQDIKYSNTNVYVVLKNKGLLRVVAVYDHGYMRIYLCMCKE